MRDDQLTNPAIWPLVQQENQRQLEKWGIQDHSPFEWMAFITEEVGEMAEAISECHYRGGTLEDVTKEAIQAATLCLKVAEMYLNAQIFDTGYLGPDP